MNNCILFTKQLKITLGHFIRDTQNNDTFILKANKTCPFSTHERVTSGYLPKQAVHNWSEYSLLGPNTRASLASTHTHNKFSHQGAGQREGQAGRGEVVPTAALGGETEASERCRRYCHRVESCPPSHRHLPPDCRNCAPPCYRH